MRGPTPRRRVASTAVEFALVALTLCLLVLGGVEYGWFFFQLNRAEEAVQQASRVAVGTLVEDDPAAVFIEELTPRLEAVQLEASYVNAEVIGEAPGRVLYVEVEVPCEGLIGFVPQPTLLDLDHSTWLEDQSRDLDDDDTTWS